LQSPHRQTSSLPSLTPAPRRRFCESMTLFSYPVRKLILTDTYPARYTPPKLKRADWPIGVLSQIGPVCPGFRQVVVCVPSHWTGSCLSAGCRRMRGCSSPATKQHLGQGATTRTISRSRPTSAAEHQPERSAGSQDRVASRNEEAPPPEALQLHCCSRMSSSSPLQTSSRELLKSEHRLVATPRQVRAIIK
jgi:hypothetical protein